MTITVPSKRLYIADVNWHEVGAIGEPAFANSWVNFGTDHATAAFRIDQEGWVHLKGLVKSGTSGNPIFTLPSGYRPRFTQRFVMAGSAAVSCTITIDSTGTVVPVLMTGATNAYFSLAGIQFPAWQLSTEFDGQEFVNNAPYFNSSLSSQQVHWIRRDNGFNVFNGVAGASSAAIMHYGNRSHLSWMFPVGGANSSTHWQFSHPGLNLSSASTTTTYTAINGEFTDFHMEDEWTTPSFTNSWTHFSTNTNPWARVAYMKDKYGWVHLRGLIASGSSATADMFTLPAGYRPEGRHLYITRANGSPARVDVYESGVVNAVSGSTTWTSLFGINFLAEN